MQIGGVPKNSFWRTTKQSINFEASRNLEEIARQKSQMTLTEIVDRYISLSTELEKIVLDAENRITCDPPDDYFVTNANFLTKSFLISLCCYLEVFLKEIANAHVSNAKQRIRDANVPHNLLTWSVVRDVKDKDLHFGVFDLSLTAKEIDDELSGNPFRTAKCFRLLGVELETVAAFSQTKDLVNTVVAKRNSIIHHNDTAADVSLGDIRGYSGHFKIYASSIAEAVNLAFPFEAEDSSS